MQNTTTDLSPWFCGPAAKQPRRTRPCRAPIATHATLSAPRNEVPALTLTGHFLVRLPHSRKVNEANYNPIILRPDASALLFQTIPQANYETKTH